MAYENLIRRWRQTSGKVLPQALETRAKALKTWRHLKTLKNRVYSDIEEENETYRELIKDLATLEQEEAFLKSVDADLSCGVVFSPSAILTGAAVFAGALLVGKELAIDAPLKEGIVASISALTGVLAYVSALLHKMERSEAFPEMVSDSKKRIDEISARWEIEE